MLWVRGEIDQIQVPDLVAVQPPGVSDLYDRHGPQLGNPPFATVSPDSMHPPVRAVEEVRELFTGMGHLSGKLSDSYVWRAAFHPRKTCAG